MFDAAVTVEAMGARLTDCGRGGWGGCGVAGRGLRRGGKGTAAWRVGWLRCGGWGGYGVAGGRLRCGGWEGCGVAGGVVAGVAARNERLWTPAVAGVAIWAVAGVAIGRARRAIQTGKIRA